MIGWLNGKILDKHQPGKLILDVNGVGYDVETSLNTFFHVENQQNNVGLHIHTVVREDALLLYGFADNSERQMFRSLIKINGVGPKLAINILSSISPSELIECVEKEDANRLTKLPGIGKKTAERLVIEMKDSVKDFSTSTSIDTNCKKTISVGHQDEAIEALEALGYRYQEARKVIKQLDDGKKSSEQLIREGLKKISHR